MALTAHTVAWSNSRLSTAWLQARQWEISLHLGPPGFDDTTRTCGVSFSIRAEDFLRPTVPVVHQTTGEYVVSVSLVQPIVLSIVGMAQNSI